ncbi:MAG: glycosyl hydrolase [Bacteriovoracaceae bacterium]|nr:glycosyl hydrolase [Bacteriovoracaceae bacterium]
MKTHTFLLTFSVFFYITIIFNGQAQEKIPNFLDGKIMVGQQNASLEGRGEEGSRWFYGMQDANNKSGPQLVKPIRSDFELTSSDQIYFRTPPKRPAVQGFELYFLTVPESMAQKSVGHDWEMARSLRQLNVLTGVPAYTEVIQKNYEQGAMITFSWHPNNPFFKDKDFKQISKPVDLSNLTHRRTDNLKFMHAYDEFHRQLDVLANFFITLKIENRPIPFVFRPFHEHNGNWFWWSITPELPGQKQKYIELWRHTISYLRKKMKNYNVEMYTAYSPDKFDLMNYPAGSEHLKRDGKISNQQEYQFIKERYLKGHPGDKWVDIYGLDIYSDDLAEVSELICFLDQLKSKTNNQKYIAITEMGNNQPSGEVGIHPEYFKMLNYIFVNNPCAKKLSYLMFWRNSGDRSGKNDEHYVPHLESPQSVIDSFVNFLALPIVQTL